MKKTIIIFSLGLSLIIGGGFITLSELSTWHTTDRTFEQEGYETKTKSVDVDIDKYTDASISEHIYLTNQAQYSYYKDINFAELESEYKVDDNQPKGLLNYAIIYYPVFGECDLRFDEYEVENNRINYRNNSHLFDGQVNRDLISDSGKIYLDLSSDCYKGHFRRNIRDYLADYQTFKTMMHLKKFPFNLQKVIITVNPSDKLKLIK